MKNDRVNALRHASRKLVRELGLLQLDKSLGKLLPQHCHALVEIEHELGISVSKLSELLVLSVSATSRLVQALIKRNLVEPQESQDRREKSLFLTENGKAELKKIDVYSNEKVEGAFSFLSLEEQEAIIKAIERYSEALEKSRNAARSIKIHTLSTSRPLRRQIVAMVEEIQKVEFEIPVTDEVNASVLRAEEAYYYNNSYNFWYATNEQGTIIGCIGLQKIDETNGQLVKLFVDKRYRGKGVAQKLIATLIKAAKKHGLTTIWLGTVEKLHGAQKFYTKCGFTKVMESRLPKGFHRCHLDLLFYSRPV